MDRKTLGRFGEETAARHLEHLGYRILHRNWRAGVHEIDLIVQRGRLVVFVEVKTRRPGPVEPTSVLSRAQRSRLVRAAGCWIRDNPGRGREFRFDLVAVTPEAGGAPSIRHIAGAFQGDG